ncbi:TPA: DUF808 domain-containing protein [Providencia stuartii]|uniref:DUF808 domain-containing protein n=1 Tax=Providencia stuartii TaxID=588 RepID=UPI001140000A|nr:MULTISPECIES: DUF808 domain-containing protein [Providencia]MBN5562639.1 DUF808 domain-containing protein [Providencia stuartii]MBN5602576.1 DUF808 domain-containing protein [Providencia stuartii]MBN5606669.1 DUF808 domain-containing protein [Providencia stuartii]MCL8327090.1 DUF808 domain-containing protein [Providencia thailandensis]MDF4176318.1 DUF808 domain-containing protein [Providencia thailandensis]
MAGSSLLALLDDIAAVLDDVSVMTKMAAKKTSGVLGDDLALNAQQVTGVRAEREIPVVWAVAKGSFINKLILVPLALLISALIPWAVTPLLMIGGAYLCFEGAEKLMHKYLHSAQEHHEKREQKAVMSPEELAAFEKSKIKGAVRTDFVLSAEIIAITLGIVSATTFMNQVIVLSIIAIVMTIGVYGLVAGIVKLDDLGFYLQKKASAWLSKLGTWLIYATPYLMKTLSVVGTAAMFMVGGGILTHGITTVYYWIEELALALSLTPAIGKVMQFITPSLANLIFGLIVGIILVLLITLAKQVKTRLSA